MPDRNDRHECFTDRPRLRAGIVLILVVLLPLQSASAAMTRLWRPAHYHPGLLTVAVEARSAERGADAAPADAVTAVASVLRASPPPATPAPQPHPAVELPAAFHPHQHRHPHSHAHPHTHTDAHDASRADASVQPPAATDVAASEPPDIDRHRPGHAALAAHAHAHAATGVGHHRHDRDDPDVVYVDDGSLPDAPATTPRRQLDGTVMLLPTPPPLPAIAAAADGMPRLRTAPLHAHFFAPPERPPR